MGFWGCWLGGAEGAQHSWQEHTCSAPWPPWEQLPHLARTEVTMAGQQTPPERLCNDRNNSSYSLPDEKKLRMDRTGKCPVSLQAYPNQNENKHLLTVQNVVLPSTGGTTAGSWSGALLQVPLSPLRLCPQENLGYIQLLRVELCYLMRITQLCPGGLCYSLLSLRQRLAKHGAGFRLDPPLGFMLQNQRMLHKWWGKCHIRGMCGRSGVQHTPTAPHWVLLLKQEAKSTFLFHKGEAKHLLLNLGILMPE